MRARDLTAADAGRRFVHPETGREHVFRGYIGDRLPTSAARMVVLAVDPFETETRGWIADAVIVDGDWELDS